MSRPVYQKMNFECRTFTMTQQKNVIISYKKCNIYKPTFIPFDIYDLYHKRMRRYIYQQFD